MTSASRCRGPILGATVADLRIQLGDSLELQLASTGVSKFTALYAVDVIVGMMRTEVTPSDVSGGWPMLALLKAQALNLPPRHQLGALRRLGDTSLFLGGLFGAAVAGGASYATAMGSTAYAQAVSLNPPMACIYRELACKFGALVDGLSGVADELGLAADARELYLRRHDGVIIVGEA